MYRVLMVCTGNICRSPAMELLLRAGVDDSVAVASAGTYGLQSAPIPEPMRAQLAGHVPQEHIEGFASRFLDRDLVADADLILTATADHRAGVLAVDPRALRRTLTLGEFARLAALVPPSEVSGNDDAERFASLVSAALAHRLKFIGQNATDDIVDPYGQSEEVYETSFKQLSHQITEILNALQN